jgi:hypothetical protein
MSIQAISAQEAIVTVAISLQVPPSTDLNIPVVSQALRRAVSILAPCPRHELERAVLKSLAGLDADDRTEALIEETTESLLVYGDILEMRPLAADAWREAAITLRPAPPSFVVRADQSIVLVGVAGDDITPLVGELRSRLEYRGPLRILTPQSSEDLRSLLKDLGLIELSESAWLRLPPVEPAPAYIAKWEADLSAAPAQLTEIEGLRVLAPAARVAFYRDRWIESDASLSGMFVGRRRQRYGKDIWCLVDLAAGRPQRFLDLFSVGDRLRPCDVAWRIQMAIDAQAGTPQFFRLRESEGACFVDFPNPLPSWAARKLMISGERADPHRAVSTYALRGNDINEINEFLRQRLWLVPEGCAGEGEARR